MRKFLTLIFKHNAFLLFLMYSTISFLFIKLEQDRVTEKLGLFSMELRERLNDRINGLTYQFNLDQENQQLMRVNRDLIVQLINEETAKRDTQQRNSLTESNKLRSSDFIIARVVNRKFSDRENVLVLNAGSKNGVEKDMTVLVPEGLVGRIVAVSEHFSRVMPVIHTDFKVSVVTDSTRSMGVLGWAGGAESIAHIDHIPISSRILPNERVITSDFSTFSVRGIPVGTIVSIKPDKLFYAIDVRLAVDFSTLDQVLVAPLKKEPEKAAMLIDSTNIDQSVP